ncbi:hypothetical protein BTJ40_12510 [Microbulbifer sp. A4B17]|uniref:hypothetical protein n=1 Tax=Microbulbifer sp. A4B17 TaxID=359370 RepID=UPI000D52ABA9|nr:hypothetical protein [Microbulbifer sp. A4B17]AWF81579.1 hypothetical protein BTJ40_12510 [Microbulbifer sp. A4B17]
MKKGAAFRRYLPVPAAVLAWVLAACFTLLLDEWHLLTFCPSDMRDGSVCYEEGWEIWSAWIVALGAIVSAFMVVCVAVLAAATAKIKVAHRAFLVGTVAASVLGFFTEYYLQALLAIASGAFACWVVHRIFSGKH